MPIYEYKCSKCGNCFEKLTASTNPGEVKCEKCGNPAQKLISSIGIVFKGPGFYTTDYKKGSNGIPAAKKNNGETPSGETKPEAQAAKTETETKSAAPASKEKAG